MKRFYFTLFLVALGFRGYSQDPWDGYCQTKGNTVGMYYFHGLEYGDFDIDLYYNHTDDYVNHTAGTAILYEGISSDFMFGTHNLNTVAAWVDFDNDGSWTDAERIFEISTTNDGLGDYYLIQNPIITPLNTVTDVALKARVIGTVNPSISGPCDDVAPEHGQIVDFWIQVQPASEACSVVNRPINHDYHLSDLNINGVTINVDADNPQYYVDQTNTIIPIDLGEQSSFSIERYSNTAGLSLWIDFNNDLVLRADEEVLSIYYSSNPLESGYFTITDDTNIILNEPLRARLMMFSGMPAPDPCDDLSEFGYDGQVIDFTVNINSKYCGVSGEYSIILSDDFDNFTFENVTVTELSDYQHVTSTPVLLTANNTFNYGLSFSSGETTFPHGSALWIDYNNNGIWEDNDDYSEKIFYDENYSDYEFQSVVPENAVTDEVLGARLLLADMDVTSSPGDIIGTNEEIFFSNPCLDFANSDSYLLYSSYTDFDVIISENPTPAAPSLLAVSNITHNSAYLTWTSNVVGGKNNISGNKSATSNTSVTHKVYVDGVFHGSTDLTSYTVTGLIPEQTYGITVTSVDSSGFESARSPALQLTTLSGAIAHYKFGGDANDASGNGHHGTAYNGASYTNDMELGDVLDLSGSGSYVELPTGILGSDRGTIHLLFLTGQQPSNVFSMLFYGTETHGNGGGGHRELHMHLNADGTLGGFIEGGTSSSDVYITSSDPVNDDAWHTATMTWNSNTIKLFLDEQLVATNSHAAYNFSFDGAMRIGAPYSDTNSRGFEGLIDNVEIYNRPLSDEEVLSKHEELINLGLIAHYPLDGNSHDITSNEHHGTVHNGASYTYDMELGDVLDLSGSGSYIELPIGILGSDRGTIHLLFLTGQQPSNVFSMLFYGTETHGNGGGGHRELHMHLNADGTLGGFIEGGTSSSDVYITSSGSVNDGAWHIATMTWDSDTIKLFLDEQLVATNSHAAYNFSFDGAMRIGAPYSDINSRGFEGLIDNVEIYNLPLSDEEVLSKHHRELLNLSSAYARKTKVSDESVGINIDTELDHNIRLYPNPTSESATMTLHVKAPGKVRVRLTDLSGRIILDKYWKFGTSGNHDIIINDLRRRGLFPGTYLLNMESATHSISKTLRLVFK